MYVMLCGQGAPPAEEWQLTWQPLSVDGAAAGACTAEALLHSLYINPTGPFTPQQPPPPLAVPLSVALSADEAHLALCLPPERPSAADDDTLMLDSAATMRLQDLRVTPCSCCSVPSLFVRSVYEVCCCVQDCTLLMHNI